MEFLLRVSFQSRMSFLRVRVTHEYTGCSQGKGLEHIGTTANASVKEDG